MALDIFFKSISSSPSHNYELVSFSPRGEVPTVGERFPLILCSATNSFDRSDIALAAANADMKCNFLKRGSKIVALAKTGFLVKILIYF